VVFRHVVATPLDVVLSSRQIDSAAPRVAAARGQGHRPRGMESIAVASGSCRAGRGLERICHLHINPLASASSSVISVARFAGWGQSFYFLTQH
jgi:hypothetical protein